MPRCTPIGRSSRPPRDLFFYTTTTARSAGSGSIGRAAWRTAGSTISRRGMRPLGFPRSRQKSSSAPYSLSRRTAASSPAPRRSSARSPARRAEGRCPGSTSAFPVSPSSRRRSTILSRAAALWSQSSRGGCRSNPGGRGNSDESERNAIEISIADRLQLALSDDSAHISLSGRMSVQGDVSEPVSAVARHAIRGCELCLPAE